MRNYEQVILEISYFAENDVITTSLDPFEEDKYDNGDWVPGEGGN